MFFLDVIDKEQEYIFYYYKCEENSLVKSYSYKITNLKKIDISSSNSIIHRFFYNLLNEKVFISNNKTIEILNTIYKNNPIFNNEKDIMYEDFYDWCIEQAKHNPDIKKRLDRFEVLKSRFEKRGDFQNPRIQSMIELYNILYLNYKNEYKKSKTTSIDEILDINISNTYHLIDTESSLDFEFLGKINIDLNDKVVFFVNNSNKSVKFTTLLKILEYKNLEFEIENYNITTLIQSYLLSLDNINKHKIKVYTSYNTLKDMEYIKNRSKTNIDIIDIHKIECIKDEDIDFIDISFNILDEDEDEDI